MDTRQLVAFCEVVDRRSFSEAAARLGVTQPAVSLQVRSLEKRLGRQLLDRSGLRLYRSAQRLLALEQQLLDEVADAGGELLGTFAVGASTGPAAVAIPIVLCEFQRANPALTVELTVSDTSSVVELGAGRGAPAPLRRLRAVLPRRGDPRLPAGAPVRRRHRRRRGPVAGATDPDAGWSRRAPGDRGRAAEDGPAAPRPGRAARARPAGVGAKRGAGRLRR